MTAALVQSALNKSSTGTVTITFSTATTAGNCIIVGSGSAKGTTNPVITGVTLGSTAFTAQANGENAAANSDSEIWYLQNCPGGQTTVTVTYSAGSGTNFGEAAWAMEWSGLATSSVLDTHPAGGSGTSTAFTSNSTGTLAHANEVLIGACSAVALTETITGPGSPWTLLAAQSQSFLHSLVGYQVVSATTSQAYSGTLSASAPWTGVIASFVAAGGNVSVALPVAQVTVAALPPAPSAGPLALPVAQVSINAYPPVPGHVVPLPAAQVTVAAFAPRPPLILPTARVTVTAFAPQPSVNVAVPLPPARVTVTAYPPRPSRQLLISLAAKAGTDDHGTAFPQGLKATAGVIEGPTIVGSDAFYYSTAAPALGALVASVAGTAGTDSAGNAYLAGSATYAGSAPHLFATSSTAGSIQFWTAASAAGPWSFYGEIEVTPTVPGILVLNFSQISGAINTPQASGITTLPLSLPPPSSYSTVYTGDMADAVNKLYAAAVAAGVIT